MEYVQLSFQIRGRPGHQVDVSAAYVPGECLVRCREGHKGLIEDVLIPFPVDIFPVHWKKALSKSEGMAGTWGKPRRKSGVLYVRVCLCFRSVGRIVAVHHRVFVERGEERGDRRAILAVLYGVVERPQ